MKNFILKFKIIITNILRVITSFLFINLSSLFQKNIEASSQSIEITCYAAGPSNDKKIPKIIEQYDLKDEIIEKDKNFIKNINKQIEEINKKF